jgi:hypothetical protein
MPNIRMIVNSKGKRLLTPHGTLDDYCVRKSPRTEDQTGDSHEGEATLTSLPDDIICNILSCLDVSSLLQSRCLNRSFRTLASQGSAGWENLCKKLWEDKVHVPREAQEHTDPMAAYRTSVEDARNRDSVRPEELIFDPSTKTGTIWSFRFKESAGSDWTSWDPWFLGQPCRKMVFVEDGSCKEYITEREEGEANLEDPPFSERRGNLFDPPMVMSWRSITKPLDMPARPFGSYIRFSVGGRDVPTYCVRRSPTKNWGFIMESCWGVYASFELPKHVPRTTPSRRRMRLRRTQDPLGNWINIEVETTDDERSEDEEEKHEGSSLTSRLLVDDDSFMVTSGLQWREAFMYNFGARELPEGEDALAEFERAYALINT